MVGAASAPPQFGQRPFIAVAQAAQNVQSYEQTRASASACSARLQRSQELFISEPICRQSRRPLAPGEEAMKAIVVEHLGELGSLKEIPRPQPASHEILVRITAAGVNPIDWKRRNRPNENFPSCLGRTLPDSLARSAIA